MQVINLNFEDKLKLIDELDKPVKMNDKFLRAARLHKETITNSKRSVEERK